MLGPNGAGKTTAISILTTTLQKTSGEVRIAGYNLDKNPSLEGRLDAIKGQYLLLDNGVINIRKYAGYLVSITVS